MPEIQKNFSAIYPKVKKIESLTQENLTLIKPAFGSERQPEHIKSYE